MIHAHKVLPAYACLVSRLVTGRFDPARQRALWPSTGNYCRGGVAISRTVGCHGVAILPAGMSDERFQWLEQLGERRPSDIVRTPGTESNVREIYDACERAGAGPGQRRAQPVQRVRQLPGALRASPGAPSRTCSSSVQARAAWAEAGRLRLGQRLGRHAGRGRLAEGKPRREDRRGRGARVPDHALQRLRRAQHPGHRRQAHPATSTTSPTPTSRWPCPTTPPTSSSCSSTTPPARPCCAPRRQRGRAGGAAALRPVEHLQHRRRDQDRQDAGPGRQPGADHRGHRRRRAVHLGVRQGRGQALRRRLRRRAGQRRPSTTHITQADTSTCCRWAEVERDRIFNLGYFTWVEQRGVALADFEARRDQAFWRGLHGLLPAWDEMIAAFNQPARGAA